MDSFVADLTRMYRLATEAKVEEFPMRALDLLREWIDFDGAVFGFGEPSAEQLNIDGVCVYHRDPALLPEYAQVCRLDPVTQRFVRRPRTIQNVDSLATYTGKENDLLARFTRGYDLRHLLLIGDEDSSHSRLRWIVLYRGTRKPFDSFEVIRMSAAWQHILCALDMNRARELDLQASPSEQRSLALVSPSGIFEVVDRAFLNTLRTEWSDLPDTRLPPAVLQALQAASSYVGRHVSVTFSHRGSHILCKARGLESNARLSVRERQVAQYYSLGYSHKEIADVLGISPNTVRVQLTHIYQKLEINSKAMLASALAALD